MSGKTIYSDRDREVLESGLRILARLIARARLKDGLGPSADSGSGEENPSIREPRREASRGRIEGR